MPEDIGVDKVEGVDAYGDDNHQLVGLVVGVVEASDTIVRVAGIVGEVGGTGIVDPEKHLILEHLHTLVVVVDQIPHARESTVDDGNLPRLVVIDLSGTGENR